MSSTLVLNPTATALARTQIRQQQAEVEAAGIAQFKKLTQLQRQGQPGLGGNATFGSTSPLVLAHYFTWFDGNGWNDCNISAGDQPLQPYHSDDPATLASHIQMAQNVGLNGFTVHWFAPNDRTDRNFSTLLDQSLDTDFASTVVFSHHIWHGLVAPNYQQIADALRYIIEQHGQHLNFLRVEGKPVIFFTDVYRTGEVSSDAPQVFWAAIRDIVDPQRQTIWIAEGLDPTYLDVFDGLYVFKISHAAYPYDYLKAPQWSERVRSWAIRTGQPKIWAATISPGWDDRRADCKPDVRVANTPHRLDRRNGETYEATFQAALDSSPDWLIVSSFNEWVEGSYIEPSEQYGDTYMRLTREFVREFQR